MSWLASRVAWRALVSIAPRLLIRDRVGTVGQPIRLHIVRERSTAVTVPAGRAAATADKNRASANMRRIHSSFPLTKAFRSGTECVGPCSILRRSTRIIPQIERGGVVEYLGLLVPCLLDSRRGWDYPEAMKNTQAFVMTLLPSLGCGRSAHGAMSW